MTQPFSCKDVKTRLSIYDKSFSGTKNKLSTQEISNFVDLALAHLEHAIKANKREDNLYHAYNLMTLEDHNKVS